jgi:transcriptional regulator with XRE-family HTH domain
VRYGVRVSNNARGGFGRYLARRMALCRPPFTTVGQLAEAIGVNRSLVSRWITGGHQPSVKHLQKLAPVLKRPVLELLVAAGHLTQREVEDSFEQMCNEQKPT